MDAQRLAENGHAHATPESGAGSMVSIAYGGDVDAFVDAIKTDYRLADLDAPTRAVLDYAMKLTLTPAKMAASDIQGLREQGFDDRAIHDIVQVIAYFNYINRVADGLDVDLEPDMPPR